MGKKTSFTLQIILVSIAVALFVVFIFTNEYNMSAGEEATETAEVASVEDGTYTGSAEGHNGPLEVEVTVEGGEISDVVVTNHEESEGIADPALEEVPVAIAENNSTEVDVASGATVTSEAIMDAVNNALNGGESGSSEDSESGAASVEYTDGTYTATVDGHNDPLEVEVTVAEGAISDVTVTNHEESEGIADPALEEVPAAIVESNSTDVDVASGATVTSEAIISAVETALADAQ
jgi:uncharacterized protein with FMN-binding domain